MEALSREAQPRAICGPIHRGLAEDLLDQLVRAEFDMTYSQDAELGHSFAAVYEWVIEGRKIPVVPLPFTVGAELFLQPLRQHRYPILIPLSPAHDQSVRPRSDRARGGTSFKALADTWPRRKYQFNPSFHSSN